jgi:pyridoxamine 5'-phosphate oxidase
MHDPLPIFDTWLKEAIACAMIREPTAMTLATADGDGKPSARMVLLKAFDERGFVFYTNLQSRKGHELKVNPYAALVFYWMPLDKQVRIDGTVVAVSASEADTYFASRERLKQAGAWASLQSEPLDKRETLIARTTDIEQKYDGKPIPRPPHWSGYRLVPGRMEFWSQGSARLHERECFTRQHNGWQHTLLYP